MSIYGSMFVFLCVYLQPFRPNAYISSSSTFGQSLPTFLDLSIYCTSIRQLYFKYMSVGNRYHFNEMCFSSWFWPTKSKSEGPILATGRWLCPWLRFITMPPTKKFARPYWDRLNRLDREYICLKTSFFCLVKTKGHEQCQ